MDQILPKTDPRSPFNVRVPRTSQPTEVLSKRFELWRQIIKSLLTYFKTMMISAQQEVEIHSNNLKSLNFTFFTDIHKVGPNLEVGGVNGVNETRYSIIEPHDKNKQSFFSSFGEGSIQDLQILLKKYHINLINQKKKNRAELTLVVSRLEDLQKDLVVKVKEIRGLVGDFKTNLSAEIANTGRYLEGYISSITKLNNNEEIEPKNDPFLRKYRLELQLKSQLREENSLEEVFINLQVTALELEKIVFKEVKESLNKYSELITQDIFIHYNDLINELHQGIISKPLYFEWDEFIKRDNGKNLVLLKHEDPVPKLKKISDIKFPYHDSILARSIRSGILLKKSKLLKTYSKSFFILTLNYLHEFKSSNLQEHATPISSIKLDDCILTESSEKKFQICVNSNTLIKTHNIVFKKPDDLSTAEFKKWIHDIKNSTSFDCLSERQDYLLAKINSNHPSRSSTPRPLLSLTTSSASIPVEKVYSKLHNLSIDANSKDNLSITTNESRISSIPVIAVHEPTPIRPDAPLLPIPLQAPVPVPVTMSGGDPSPAPIEVPTTPIRVPERVKTPLIGTISPPDIESNFNLDQRLYTDTDQEVDLNTILNKTNE